MSGMMNKHDGSFKKNRHIRRNNQVSLVHLCPNIKVKHVLCENRNFSQDQMNNPPCNAIHMEM